METTNNDIFFRTNEYESLVKSSIQKADIINSEAVEYFKNTSNVDQLIFKASILEDSSFLTTALLLKIDAIKEGQTSNRNYSSHTSILEYFNDYTYDIYPLTNTKFFFWFTIVIILLIFAIKIKYSKFKLPKLLFFIVLCLIGLNLFNYYVKEPEILKSMEENIDYKTYKKQAYLDYGLDALEYIDIPIEPKKYYYENSYSYNINGYDEMNNNVYGEITTSGKYGDGYVIKDGNRINIEVEWTGNGILEGKDENGIIYNLEVD